MSQKLRGEEVTVRITVDGDLLGGSLIKLKSFTPTPRTDINEDDYLGEQHTDLDIQHHGWDLGFEFDHEDETGIELTELIIANEEAHLPHPDITITEIFTFRAPGARGKMAVYSDLTLKCSEESVGGRKEKVKGKFEGKCKQRKILEV